MNNIDEGCVVITKTTQAGTVIQMDGSEAWVLLANGDIWTGPLHSVREPQDQADLNACPLEVERFVEREKKNFVSKERD